ncbi:hypothetical protein NA56DRAFT_708582 [Hyaloscypha hepaticicola]|uniref:Chromo domain-containing protein n=1 Tax=Hyaloscypha hepaticicola TaxID=2082293 RepID=A0A2J6PRW9_9HELO|nr:hypothetical protein NA56DRAFT_708582 [Hyaloscypha hepaticicola]
MASSPPPISNSSSTLFHDRFLKHGSSSSTNASVVLPSGRELQAEVSDFKMGTNQTSPTKNSSFSLIKKPSTAEDTNASLSETPTKAPTEKGKKRKLENKKSKALQRVTNPAYKKGISSGYGIDLDTDSDDDSDIPAVAQRKPKPIAKVADSANISGSQTTEPSARSSKRKHPSFENTNGDGSISKRRANKIATNNATITSKPQKDQKDLQGKTYLVEKILAKGWMAHSGSEVKGVDPEREWRYLIQWAKSEDGQTWEPTWEPLSTMYDGGHKQRMAAMFEDRMKDEHSEGASAWADVLEEEEIEEETKQEKNVLKKNKKGKY